MASDLASGKSQPQASGVQALMLRDPGPTPRPFWASASPSVDKSTDGKVSGGLPTSTSAILRASTCAPALGKRAIVAAREGDGPPWRQGQGILGCLAILPKGTPRATEMCTQHRKGSSVYPDPRPGHSPQALRHLRPLPAWLQLLPSEVTQ